MAGVIEIGGGASEESSGIAENQSFGAAA